MLIDIVLEYIKKRNISRRKFETTVGLSNAYLANIKSSRSEIQPEKWAKIINVYPELKTIAENTAKSSLSENYIEKLEEQNSDLKTTIAAIDQRLDDFQKKIDFNFQTIVSLIADTNAGTLQVLSFLKELVGMNANNNESSSVPQSQKTGKRKQKVVHP